MATSPCEAYLESEILSADPIELVQVLYRAALEAVGNARRYLRQGDIASRSKQITRASIILTELTLAVDRKSGKSLSSNLIELYDYMQRRLIVANVEQCDPPMAEVAQLLGTLLEGWMSCRVGPKPWPDAPAAPPAQLTPEYAPQSWSL